MAWTTPKTWASGYVVLASDLNTHLRDNLNVTAPAVLTAQGDILYASGANAPARLAKDANSTRSLTNTGGSNNPAWAQVALATGVSGTLPVGSGGIGTNTLTANGALIGNGSSAISAVDMSTKGGLLAGDGSGNPRVLAVGGSDNHVLTVDSGETTGMKWAGVASLQSKIVTVTRTAAAGSGDQAVTGAGFQPTALIVLGLETAETPRGSIGIGDVALGEQVLRHAGAAIVWGQAPAIINLSDGTDYMGGVLKTLDADGFTLTWTKGGAGVNVTGLVLCLR